MYNVGNGVLTALWVMTALADRFLLIASLLSKKAYCRSRRQANFKRPPRRWQKKLLYQRGPRKGRRTIIQAI